MSPLIFACGGEDDFDRELFETLKTRSVPYNPALHDNIDTKKLGEDEIVNIVTTQYYNGEKLASAGWYTYIYYILCKYTLVRTC